MAKTPPDPLARAYHRSLALRWLAAVLPMPALVPLLLGRGLDLAEVGLVLATFAAVTAALEVPTGGLADAVGRVEVTLAADVLAAAGRLGMLLAASLEAFLLAAALSGVARALGSGSLEAWYVDALRRGAPQADLQGVLARAGVIQALALGAGTLAGGAVPLLAPVLGLGSAGGVPALQLAFAASIAVGLLALATTVPLRRHHVGPRAGRGAARPDRVALDAWRSMRGDPALAALTGLGAATGALIMAFEAFFPAELRGRLGDGAVTPLLGAALAGAFAATAIGQGLGGGSARDRPARRPLGRAALGHLLTGAALLGLAAQLGGGATAAAIAVGSLWLAYLGLGVASPTLAAAFHARVPAARRAALLSVRSLAFFAGGVAAMLVLGPLGAAVGLTAVWLVAAAIALSAAALMTLWGAAEPAQAGPATRVISGERSA